jgi:hypothetical protein
MKQATRAAHDVTALMGMSDEAHLYWTEVLTGLEPQRVSAARAEIASSGFRQLEALLADDVDAATAP